MDLKPERLEALDATRGLAILLMVLSGVIPYGTLPDWMYHAQIPPPAHIYNPKLPGFTWVDLVFPLFIFCLGIAIPIAFQKKKILGLKQIILYLFKRTFLLVAFSIIVQHVRPHQMEANPSTQTWLLALLGFLFLFLCFSTYPFNISKKLKGYLRVFSWACLLVLLSQLTYKNGEGFSLYRSDIIILVLANVYFFGAIIYLTTQNKWIPKFLIAFFLLGLRLLAINTDWITRIEAFNAVSWLFQIKFLQYLFIAIPGIVIGEILLKKSLKVTNLALKSRGYLLFICLLSSTATIVFLHARIVWPIAVIINSLNLLIIIVLFRKTESTQVFQVYLLASLLLFLGFVTEPFEGGIKKDPSTLSYYFISAGISCYVLLTFLLMEAKYFHKPLLALIVNNGKNPMIAYVAFANLIWPILALTGLEVWLVKITSPPWVGFLRGLSYTFIIALLVSYFTRKRFFWKT